MTERSRRDLSRQDDRLRIGPSELVWNGESLEIDINEVTVPWPSRLRGKVILTPSTMLNAAPADCLDTAGRHFWQPIAPCARVDVDMLSPRLAWQGTGYWDGNFGSEPLQDAFTGWHWSRTHPLQHPAPGAAESMVIYDVDRRSGTPLRLAKKFSKGNAGELIVADFKPPPVATLAQSAWHIPRQTRSDTPEGARLVATLEDGPFYARSQIETTVDGIRGIGVHESLSLDRFRSPWVQALLPFKMPRRS